MNEIHPSGGADLPLRAIPPLTALLAFERAATQLSFRRAARDLALSPSAISHQIRGLEQQFGIKLFVRGARSVRLTADGERYLAKVSVALAGLQEAGREMLRQARRRQRTLDQRLAVFHLDCASAGAAGVQAAQSRSDAADRGHASICRFQRLTGRCRDPLRPRTSSAGLKFELWLPSRDCRCVRQRWSARACARPKTCPARS
jgi:hypothetical protein